MGAAKSLGVTVAVGLAGTAVLTLAGCAGLRTSDQPPPGFSLAGTWKLNPQLSTDTRAALQHIVPAQRRKPPPPEDESSADQSSSDTSDEPAVARRYQAQLMQGRNELPIDISLQRSLLSGGDYLRIQQRPDAFVVWNGDTTDSYVPGEKSVVSVPSGVADQKSGWKGKEYWIEIRPQVGPSVTEKFRLSDDGKRLIETINVDGEGRVRKLEVTRVYDPTNEVPAIVPGGD